MSSVIDTTSETIGLKSPATLADLENILWQLHPALQTLQWFQVLLNGTAAAGNPDLSNDDVVVFLTRMGGG
jgi:molybdopterin converting factor small subunit